MDVALVEDAEHDVDDHDGDDEQHGQVRQRALERLGRALELAADAVGQRRGRPLRGRASARRRATRRAARPNEMRHRGQLTVVIHGLRTDDLRVARQRVERHHDARRSPCQLVRRPCHVAARSPAACRLTVRRLSRRSVSP